MSTNERSQDDLTQISGIKAKRQNFLRENLNVRTYQDLAALSVDDITSAFANAGKPISRKTVQSWIAEAAAKTPAADQKVESIQTVAEGKWEWLERIFVVEFRVFRLQGDVTKREIRVNQAKATKNGSWLDNGTKSPIVLQGEELYPWMVDQLGQEAWPEPEAQAGAVAKTDEAGAPVHSAALAKHPSKSLEITQLRAIPAASSSPPVTLDRIEQKLTIPGEDDVDLEITFEFDDMALLKQRASYIAKFYVFGGGHAISLGDSDAESSQPGTTTYHARLVGARVPSDTDFLGVLVSIRTQPPTLITLEIPLV